jgi:MscS family membrane protein
MNTRHHVLRVTLSVPAWLVLVAFVSVVAFAQTGQPESVPAPATDTPTIRSEETALALQDSGSNAGQTPAPANTKPLERVVITRTPAPTATPGLLDRQAQQLTAVAGWTSISFLGLPAEDWISLGFSLLMVAVGYLLGTIVIRRLLPRVVRRTSTTFDDRFLDRIGDQIRWLVVLLSLYYATKRLGFVSAEAKAGLSDIYFVVGLFLATRIFWRLIDLADVWYREHLRRLDRLSDLEPVMVVLVRLSRVLAGVLALTVLLSRFGVDVTALAAALGIGGLAISLAAKDTVSDAISGFIILVDRPFRIGDRIEIQEAGTWGDVVDIGLRTTRIRTRDNRMVIVPNSVIGSNQVINYTYPDPRYRIQTHVGVAYGTDIERAREAIVAAVSRVEGVLLDRPVDALYIEMGESAMIFRVRWWIESYVDTRRMFDRVHTVLQKALDQAGIESPFPTTNVNLNSEPPCGKA